MKLGTVLFIFFLIMIGVYTSGHIHDDAYNRHIETIIDFSLPSNVKRLTVIDTVTHEVLLKTYCSHGEGSGRLYATRFSNEPNSHCTSLGRYLTLSPYYEEGHLRLRLKGLDPSNSNAYSRNIVIHCAPYAREDYIEKYDMMGRSFGCFTVPPDQVDRLVNLIKNGTIVVAVVHD